MRLVLLPIVCIALIVTMFIYLSANTYALSEVSLEEQLTTLGGACYPKCDVANYPCWKHHCTGHSDCVGGEYHCEDNTRKEICFTSREADSPCIVDTPHDCSPKKILTGDCGGGGDDGYCNTFAGNHGDCTDEQVELCHN